MTTETVNFYEHCLNEYGINFMENFKMTPLLNNLQPVSNGHLVDDFPTTILYSSDEIYNAMTNIFNDSHILKPVIKKVNALLGTNKIIVGYINPNYFNFLYKKLKSIMGIKNSLVLGFYDNITDTIFLVLDDSINLFGRDTKGLDIILAHELCHMASYQFKYTNIHNLFRNDIFKFYYNIIVEMWNLYFKDSNFPQERDVKVELNNVIDKLFLRNDCSKFSMDVKINNTFVIWKDFFTKLYPSKEDEFIPSMMAQSLMIVYLENYSGDMFITSNIKYNKNKIEKMFYNSYKNVFGLNNLVTEPGQEIIYPSEIIAITNQFGLNHKAITAINKIKV